MENKKQKEFEKVFDESICSVLFKTEHGETKLTPVGGLICLCTAFAFFEVLSIIFKKGDSNNA